MPTWLIALDRHFPIRYLTLLTASMALLAGMLSWFTLHQGLWLALLGATGLVIGLRDLRQTRHALLRNYPVIGHIRFLFEWVRPEIRQYLLESDREAVPFSRQQRSLVYQRSKGESDKRPFGTQLDVGQAGYEWINHSLQPSTLAGHDFRVSIGGDRCSQPYSASLFNISAMSFGALSANAILALNGGAKAGGFMHDTGEGSISVHHRQNGGDLVWEIGSGYFGCRGDDGSFNEAKFEANALDPQVKLIELKLSQGAKPGHGGVLPGPKVSIEIASARGVPMGVDCVSPAAHSAFSTPLGMLQFLDRLRKLSGGKPVGFKLCIGHPWEWFALAKAIAIEFGPFGITANAVAPGIVDTERDLAHYPDATSADSDRGFAARKAAMPLRRFGHVDDISSACSFLCSAAGGFLTILPILFVALVLHRYLLSGLTAGAIK